MPENNNRDLIYLMTLIHLKQGETWVEAMLQFKNTRQEFKMLSNRVLGSLRQLLKFMQVNNTDEYEISARISDSIVRMAKMNYEEQEQIFKLVEQIEKQNYGKQNNP